LILSGAILDLRTLQDVHLLHWQSLLAPAAIVAAAMMFALSRADWGKHKPTGVTLILFAIFFFYLMAAGSSLRPILCWTLQLRTDIKRPSLINTLPAAVRVRPINYALGLGDRARTPSSSRCRAGSTTPSCAATPSASICGAALCGLSGMSFPPAKNLLEMAILPGELNPELKVNGGRCPIMVPAMTQPETSQPLNNAFQQQDKLFASAFSLIEQAIAQRAFPSASVAVTHSGRLGALKAFGHFLYRDESNSRESTMRQSAQHAVSPSTLFDLASLTKVVATTPMAMILYERGLLDLDAPVAAVIPEFTSDTKKDPRRREVTLRMLLAHSSGLPAYEKLFLKFSTRDELLQAAFTVPLTANPATRAEYSDIGFIILGVALERLADESLDSFCQREIFAPLAMSSTTFNPPAELRAQIPPTADESSCGADTLVRQLPAAAPGSSESQQSPRSTLRQKIIQGEVQDENAYVLGGVAGHAGLFSTAQDLAIYAHALLAGGVPILRPETISLFTRRALAPSGTSRGLGWDTPSAPSQSGKYFSPQSYGHLGYTGTSLWIDPLRRLSITLLTNRTWPDCSNQAIKIIRPKFHDAVIEAVEKSM